MFPKSIYSMHFRKCMSFYAWQITKVCSVSDVWLVSAVVLLNDAAIFVIHSLHIISPRCAGSLLVQLMTDSHMDADGHPHTLVAEPLCVRQKSCFQLLHFRFHLKCWETQWMGSELEAIFETATVIKLQIYANTLDNSFSYQTSR